jgi:hypothetical protein
MEDVTVKRLLLTGAMLFVAAWAWALDEPKKGAPPAKEPPASLAERIKNLEKELTTKRNDLIKRVQETKDNEEREKIIQEFRELQSSAGPRFLELVRKQPQDPAALGALKSVLNFGNSQKDRKEVIKMLAEHHATRSGIGDLALQLADDDPAVLAFLQQVSQSNPNHDDQGKALFALGAMYKRKAAGDDTKEDERAQAKAEASKALQTVLTKFADVQVKDKTLAKLAEGYLAGLKNIERLQVGKEAPEIEGQDLDGKPFKLSDYRGKVVFLDYWAHW